jgi:hypothetical protein
VQHPFSLDAFPQSCSLEVDTILQTHSIKGSRERSTKTRLELSYRYLELCLSKIELQANEETDGIGKTGGSLIAIRLTLVILAV